MNELARRAVTMYISKKKPSNQVLLPFAMEQKMQTELSGLPGSEVAAIARLDQVLQEYGKELEATYQYYKAAVQASYDSDFGIGFGFGDEDGDSEMGFEMFGAAG